MVDIVVFVVVVIVVFIVLLTRLISDKCILHGGFIKLISEKNSKYKLVQCLAYGVKHPDRLNLKKDPGTARSFYYLISTYPSLLLS